LWLVICAGLALGARGESRSRVVTRCDEPPMLVPTADDRPLTPPSPVSERRVTTTSGGRLRAHHLGSLHPARAALAVGAELWLATPSGVLRFDASLWTEGSITPRGAIDVAHGLPAPQVNALLRRHGAVWAATDAGLARLTLAGHVQQVSLRGERVTALAPDHVGTWRGLYRWRADSLELVRGSERHAITALLSCRGSLYVGTHDVGLLRLHRGELRPVRGVPAARVGALAGCRVDERVWAGTTDGLRAVEGDQAVEAPIHSRHVTTLLDLDEALLIGTYGEGLLVAREGQVRPLLPAGRIALLERGPRGELLVGTDEALHLLSPDGALSTLPLLGPPAGPVTAIAVDGSALWVGTFDRGLARLDGGRWERPAIFDPRITSLQLDGAGRMWAGTAAGLAVAREGRFLPVRDPRGWLARHVSALRRQTLDPDRDAEPPPPSAPGSDRDPAASERLWAAVHPGLVVINPAVDPPAVRYFGARGKDADAGLVGPTIYGVAFSPAGIWIGTDDGLSQMTGDRVRSLTDLGGVLPDNWINDVRAVGDVVYLLTLRSGLLRLAPDGTQIWTTSGFMTSPSVLLPLGDGLVFGTNAAGLVVVSSSGAARSYGPQQGLASAMVTALAYEPDADRLWIGGSGGIDRIDHASVVLALKNRSQSRRAEARSWYGNKRRASSAGGPAPAAALHKEARR
jgi:ligand-binding sensor domain-containing protein